MPVQFICYKADVCIHHRRVVSWFQITSNMWWSYFNSRGPTFSSSMWSLRKFIMHSLLSLHIQAARFNRSLPWTHSQGRITGDNMLILFGADESQTIVALVCIPPLRQFAVPTSPLLGKRCRCSSYATKQMCISTIVEL